jgi:hypothetical protein
VRVPVFAFGLDEGGEGMGSGASADFEGLSADRITDEQLVGELEADRRPLGGDPGGCL